MARFGFAWQKGMAQWLVPMLAALPLGLAGYWIGLWVVLALVPLAFWGFRSACRAAPQQAALPDRKAFALSLDDILASPPEAGKTACFVLCPAVENDVPAQMQPADIACLTRRIAERLRIALSEDDLVGRLDAGCFAVALQPRPGLDTEELIQITARLQSSCALPFHIGHSKISVALACGVCPSEEMYPSTGAALLERAESEARQAKCVARNAIRIARPATRAPSTRAKSSLDLRFQPRIDSNTGRVSGLTVWPVTPAPIGKIKPTLFPERFSGALLRQLAGTLATWRGPDTDEVALILRLPWRDLLASTEADQILWQIDRYDLPAHRLALVIDAPTLALPQIRPPLSALREAGCRIEVALTALSPDCPPDRRTADCLHLPQRAVDAVGRSAAGPERVAALIAQAEVFGIETAAEGISTIADLWLLAQLGCTHLSGQAVALPIPAGAVPDWIARNNRKLRAAPDIRPCPEARRKE